MVVPESDEDVAMSSVNGEAGDVAEDSPVVGVEEVGVLREPS
jgi:hypothetical protein